MATPYGVMRVYEWGPRDGEKMLFIHGDTTPAPMLGPVAHKLVDKGCRVMMFGTSISGDNTLSGTMARNRSSVVSCAPDADYSFHGRSLGQRVLRHSSRHPA